MAADIGKRPVKKRERYEKTSSSSSSSSSSSKEEKSEVGRERKNMERLLTSSSS
jgi:hypothetical protein